jgi:SAM-dependent methyltransferase
MTVQNSTMTTTQELFRTVPCPLCGSHEFDTRRAAQYPPSVDPEELKQIFHASSDHVLLDQVVQCRACSLVYVNPQIRPDLILSGYAEAEDPLFVAQNDARILAFEKTLRTILRRQGLSGQGKRMLDVGCASGACLVAARQLGFDVVGVEPSVWMAAFGRRTFGLDIRDGILEPGMFPPASFDVVTLWDVLEHIPRPHETLLLIRSLLKPGGLLVVNYPDIASIVARLLGRRWPFWLSVHLLYYTPKTIAAQLERAGFSPLWRAPFWMILPLGYVARRAAPYSALLKGLPVVADALRLSRLPIRYNMGQTLVVSRVAPART